MFMCVVYAVVYGEGYVYVYVCDVCSCVWRRIYVCLCVGCMQLCEGSHRCPALHALLFPKRGLLMNLELTAFPLSGWPASGSDDPVFILHHTGLTSMDIHIQC